MRALRNNTALRLLGKIGRSDVIEIAGKALTWAGIGIGAWQNYSSDRANKDSIGASLGESAVQTAGDAVISYADVAVGAETGFAIGTVLGGPAGSLIGAGVGAAVGAGVAFFESNAFNSGVDTASHTIGSGVSDAVNFFGL
jgi:hypothetical protein